MAVTCALFAGGAAGASAGISIGFLDVTDGASRRTMSGESILMSFSSSNKNFRMFGDDKLGWDVVAVPGISVCDAIGRCGGAGATLLVGVRTSPTDSSFSLTFVCDARKLSELALSGDLT